MFTMKDVERTTAYCPGVGGMSSWLPTEIYKCIVIRKYLNNVNIVIMQMPILFANTCWEVSSLS